MALTGNTVQSTYLDLVQLEQSGAGLPSHAGAEAALYDGSGAQIIGRTAQRHWLDPHPDAINVGTETWEFSTMADQTQGQLESAGWTFDGVDGSVSNGIFWLSNENTSGPAWGRASLAVSLTGDFDFVISPIWPMGYATNQGSIADASMGGGGVAFVSGNDAHHAYSRFSNGTGYIYRYTAGSWTAGGGSETNTITYSSAGLIRISRVSGTVYLYGAQFDNVGAVLLEDMTTPASHGWTTAASASDSQTFDKFFIAPARRNGTNTSGQLCGFRFIRRFQ